MSTKDKFSFLFLTVTPCHLLAPYLDAALYQFLSPVLVENTLFRENNHWREV